MRVHFLTLLIFTVLATGFGARQAMAASATANSTATVVTPIAISATQDLLFGKLSAGTGGTVVISTAGARSKTGGVTLVSTGSTQNQAIFHVTGDANATYAITLPGSAASLSDGAGHTMSVDTWTSNPNGTGTLSGAGAEDVNVGATLTVGNAQTAGSYSGTFSVSVDYN